MDERTGEVVLEVAAEEGPERTPSSCLFFAFCAFSASRAADTKVRWWSKRTEKKITVEIDTKKEVRKG